MHTESHKAQQILQGFLKTIFILLFTLGANVIAVIIIFCQIQDYFLVQRLFQDIQITSFKAPLSHSRLVQYVRFGKKKKNTEEEKVKCIFLSDSLIHIQNSLIHATSILWTNQVNVN